LINYISLINFGVLLTVHLILIRTLSHLWESIMAKLS